jgi:hypothetical protein
MLVFWYSLIFPKRLSVCCQSLRRAYLYDNIKRYPCQTDMNLCTFLIRNRPKEMHEGLNSLIILVAGEVWTFGNTCVFEGISPNI